MLTCRVRSSVLFGDYAINDWSTDRVKEPDSRANKEPVSWKTGVGAI